MNWLAANSIQFAEVSLRLAPVPMLLALLPVLLLGIVCLLVSTLQPNGFKNLLRFLWYQKLFTLGLLLLIVSGFTGQPWRWLLPQREWQPSQTDSASANGPAASGVSERTMEPEDDDRNFASSPAVSGERGGVADDEPIGGRAVIAWRYPEKTVERFRFTSPLLPLNNFLYATVQTDDGPKLLKLTPATVESDDQRVTWAIPLQRPVVQAPAGKNDRLFLVEEHDPDLHTNAKLVCVDARSGRQLWSQDAGRSAEPVVAVADVVIARKNQTTLLGFDAATGRERWTLTLDGPGIGGPAICQGVLLTVTARTLLAIDPITGTRLWQTRVSNPPINGPLPLGSDVVIPKMLSLVRRRVTDGSVVWITSPGTAIAPPVTNGEVIASIVRENEQRSELVIFQSTTRAEITRADFFRAATLRQSVPPLITPTRLLFAATANAESSTEIFSLNPREGAVSSWCSLGAGLQITQPLIAMRGHVFAVVNDNSLLCLTPTQP